MAPCTDIVVYVKKPPDPDPDFIPPDLLAVAHALSLPSPPGLCAPSVMAELFESEVRDNPPLKNRELQTVVSEVHSSTPASKASPAVNPSLSWADKFRSSLRNLKHLAPPTFLADGTPSVMAPDSVQLGDSHLWKDYLIAQFHGTPPSVAKIFSDLNPIWGKQGRISVKKHSNSSCLILIPCEADRNWVLDVGFWQSGNCSFSVSPWSPTACLISAPLITAPVWVILRNIPPRLYSVDGISAIASGIGEPLYTEEPIVESSPRSVIKVKIKVVLDRLQPSTVCVKDKFGNSVTVAAQYPRLPPRCEKCTEFGHQALRCPSSIEGINLVEPTHSPRNSSCGHIKESSALSPTGASPSEKSTSSMGGTKLRSSSADGWVYVAKRSRVIPKTSPSPPAASSHVSLTSEDFHSEEDNIISSQKMLRQRSLSQPPSSSRPLSPKAGKKARQKLRKVIMDQLIGGSSPPPSPSAGSLPTQPEILDTRGRTHQRLAPPLPKA